ncbi:uncharacterized protein LOC133187131 [Saccostrea echinata]|uniref:uncharacterized protein LOC133187131 n=1 Tax=Saccostrea echinata TaxID=191078 RepID=UPI002A8140DD|nr:uncharacterized protein LOC133187131 [Saccostrea echinata]
MYADPDTGLINAEGFRSILQCLRLCPSEAFVKRIFKEHDKDPEKSYITKEEFMTWMKGNWNSREEIQKQLVSAIRELYGTDGKESVEDVKISVEDLISTLTTAGEEPLSEDEAGIVMAELKKLDSVGVGKITGRELIEFLQGTSRKEKSSVERSTIEPEGPES